MKRLIFVTMVLFSTPAFAEDVSVRTLCEMLPQYQPSADVNYTPGIDAHGRAVVPGDVNKVLNNSFDAVEIPVEYSVINNLGVTLPPGSQMQPTVAILRVYHDGRVKYNDQDVSQQAQGLCNGVSRSANSSATINGQGITGVYYNPHEEPKVLGQIQKAR